MNISDEAGKNSNAVQAKKLPSSILRKKKCLLECYCQLLKHLVSSYLFVETSWV